MTYPQPSVWIPARPEEERPGGAIVGAVVAIGGSLALIAIGAGVMTLAHLVSRWWS
jgi:hypothetical protein